MGHMLWKYVKFRTFILTNGFQRIGKIRKRKYEVKERNWGVFCMVFCNTFNCKFFSVFTLGFKMFRRFFSHPTSSLPQYTFQYMILWKRLAKEMDIKKLCPFFHPFHNLLLIYRSGNEEKLMALLTPLNVNCHASDGRKVIPALYFNYLRKANLSILVSMDV